MSGVISVFLRFFNNHHHNKLTVAGFAPLDGCCSVTLEILMLLLFRLGIVPYGAGAIEVIRLAFCR